MVVSCPVCDRETATSHVYRKDGYEIVRCRVCGLVRREVLPTDEELAEIYVDAYFSKAAGDTGGRGYADYVGEADLHREAARRRLRLLDRYVQPGRLVDVGAAAGFFVAEALALGWEAKGVDIAPAMVAWAADELGVDVQLGTLADVGVTTESLAAVTMWDYLEHSLRPRDDVTRAFELLRPGGVLALSTGDVDSLVARVSRSRWHLLTPRHHNFFFSRSTLGRLLCDVGFEVEYLRHPGQRYSLGYVAFKMRTALDVAPVRAAGDALTERRLGRLSLPINLWDIVTVVGRRPL